MTKSGIKSDKENEDHKQSEDSDNGSEEESLEIIYDGEGTVIIKDVNSDDIGEYEDIEEVEPPNAQFTAFRLIDQHALFTPTLFWKIDNYDWKMIRNYEFNFDSKRFYWPSRSVVSIVVLKVLIDLDVCVYCYVDQVEKGVPMNVKVLPTVYYLLYDQRGTGSHRVRFKNYSFPKTFDSDTNYFMEFFVSYFHIDPNSLYLVDNCVVIKTYVEPLWATMKVHSQDGTLKWTIEEYSKRKRMEEKYQVKYQQSPYFYTDPSGYRLQARARLNFLKDGQSWLRLGVQVLTGVNDLTLSGQFKHLTTFNLTNPTNRDSLTKQMVTDQTRPKYFVDMVFSERVEQLLNDDSLLCHVTITPCFKRPLDQTLEEKGTDAKRRN